MLSAKDSGRLLELVLLERDRADVVDRARDVRGVAELAHHGEAPLEVNRGATKVALTQRNVPSVVLGEGEQSRVAEGRAATDALVEDLCRAHELALRLENRAEVAERSRDAFLVAQLLVQRQRRLGKRACERIVAVHRAPARTVDEAPSL